MFDLIANDGDQDQTDNKTDSSLDWSINNKPHRIIRCFLR